MNRIIIVATALSVAAAPAMAACSGTPLTGTALLALLNSNSVGSGTTCTAAGCASSATMTWVHSPVTNDNDSIVGTTNGSNFYDYKGGVSNTADPPKLMGTWAITGGSGTGTVTYTYTGGTAYAYQVYAFTASHNISAATQSGTNVTVTFSAQNGTTPVGSSVTISGATVASGANNYNGTFTVTASTNSTATYVETAASGTYNANSGTISFASGADYTFCETSGGTGQYGVTINHTP